MKAFKYCPICKGSGVFKDDRIYLPCSCIFWKYLPYRKEIEALDYGDLPVPLFEVTSTSNYPDNWSEIANKVKDNVGWHCIRCGHEHDVASGRMLTVHHLVPAHEVPWLTLWWNLIPLCQACHLHMEHINIHQNYMFEHSQWFKVYVAGYYAWRNGMDCTRENVTRLLELYLNLGLPLG